MRIPIIRLRDVELIGDRFSFAHAQFVWDAKAEPGVRDVYAQVWGTDKLTVSYGMQYRYLASQIVAQVSRWWYIGVSNS